MFKKNAGHVTADGFRKSSHSPIANGVWCVEVKAGDDLMIIRDSKNPNGGTLSFTHAEWNAFCKGVKDGQFDI